MTKSSQSQPGQDQREKGSCFCDTDRQDWRFSASWKKDTNQRKLSTATTMTGEKKSSSPPSPSSVVVAALVVLVVFFADVVSSDVVSGGVDSGVSEKRGNLTLSEHASAR
ncbi:hypothetical protein ACOMHN_014270 [Nucella lapillus]